MITIRKENKIDYEKVFELNALAFGQDNEANLVELLRKSESFVPELSIVAINDDELIGHILFTKIKIINENTRTDDITVALIIIYFSIRSSFIFCSIVLDFPIFNNFSG